MHEFPKFNYDGVEDGMEKKMENKKFVTQCPHCDKFFGEHYAEAVTDPEVKKNFEISHITCDECFLGELKSNMKEAIKLGHDPEKLLDGYEKYMENQEYDEKKKKEIMAELRKAE